MNFFIKSEIINKIPISKSLIYFNNKYLNDNLDLSCFRRNDYMNVALAARPYEQISDYFISKNNLDNGYMIIKNDKIVPPKKNYPTYLEYKKIIKIGYTDIKDEKFIFYLNNLNKILGIKYSFVFSQENPDYLIFSFYGCKHNEIKYNNSIKIAIYEEGFFPSFKEEDYVFGVNHILYLDRYFRINPLIEYLNDLNLTNQDFRSIRKRVKNEPKRNKFCGVIIDNETNHNNFIEFFIKELNEYKIVDNGGNLGNNIGINITINQVKFFESYKFSIVFEKNSVDGFSTGTILYALLAGTIPIYYGDYLIDEYINPKTFILVRNHVDLKEKIEYIKKIDQNDELFNEFFKEDVLIDENIYKKRKRDELNFWNHIFVQKKDDAKRIDNIYKNRPCKKKQ